MNNLIAYGVYCTWWDSKEKVSTNRAGIPCCPHCLCVLFEIVEGVWNQCMNDFDTTHSGYKKMMMWARGKCFTSMLMLKEAYSLARALEPVEKKPVEKMTRVPWDIYFMNIATSVATRSTCDRKFVGAVIVRDKTILSTGYNGSIRSLPHCSDVGHQMVDGHCVATIHAEANAIIQAAKNGVNIDGATIYTTASPCWSCFKLIANAGLKKICFGEFYRDERIFEMALKIGMELVDLSVNKTSSQVINLGSEMT